jgi:epoxyqueuosine reductase
MDAERTPPTWTPALTDWLRTRALAAGFDLAGVAAAPASASPDGALTADRFESWLDRGHAGEMDYLKRRAESGELLRRSARVAMPWARSIVVCAFNYNAAAPRSIDPAPPNTGWIARYAWNGDPDGNPTDYHTDLLARLKLLEADLLTRTPDGTQTKSFVDTGPLLERDFAARAGVGWIGKNTCVLNQNLGSWLLLGVIVTSLDLPAAVQAVASLPAPDRCGSCTRCIDACPTGALLATRNPDSPRQMDASRCIAYLTIELKGEIPTALREPIGRQVFGCDICQDVCPWNRRAPAAEKDGLRTRSELINPTLAWLASLDAAAFKREFKGSPLERTRRRRLHRNVAIAMGNSADPAHTLQLETWATGEDPILAESATWALQRLKPATDL